MPRNAALYVYALAAPGLPRQLRVRGLPLKSIVIGKVAAIVEARVEAPAISEASLREQHAVILDLWRRTDALLPVRFGSLIARDALESHLTAGQSALTRALEQVRGRVQMTVRILGDPPAAPLPARVPRETSGTAYLSARRQRTAVAERDVVRIRRVVTRFVVDERVDPGVGAVRASVFHLIAAADVGGYRTALATATAAAPVRRLVVTGPWPAFAFAPEFPR